MNWKIWYDDETVAIGVTEQDWNACSRDGVLIIRQYGEKNRVFMGCDYYWFEHDNIKSCNPKDLHGYLRRPEGLKNVKFGRWGNENIWKKVHDEAMIK